MNVREMNKKQFNAILKIILSSYISLVSIIFIGFFLIGINLRQIDVKIGHLAYGQRYSDWINESTEDIVELEGLYVRQNYYCVWTQGKEGNISELDPYLQEIEETAVHEYCHALVHDNNIHFCGLI